MTTLYQEFIGTIIEVKTKKNYFYHGEMLGESDHEIKIKDVKNGKMIINKSEVQSLRQMTNIEIKLMSSKMDTIGDKIIMGLKKDAEEVEARFKHFKENLK